MNKPSQTEPEQLFSSNMRSIFDSWVGSRPDHDSHNKQTTLELVWDQTEATSSRRSATESLLTGLNIAGVKTPLHTSYTYTHTTLEPCI